MLEIRTTPPENVAVREYILGVRPNKGPQKVILPCDAKILSVVNKDNQATIFAEVDTAYLKDKSCTCTYEFAIWGTGVIRAYDAKNEFTFLGTIQLDFGEFYHVYYRPCGS